MAEELNLEPVIKEIQDFFESNYKKKIYSLVSRYPTQKSLSVDYEDFEKFSPELADQLIEKPDMILKAAVKALLDMNLAVAPGIEFKPHVRFFNLPESGMLIESMGSKYLGKLINIKGVVTKRAEIKHRVKIAVYKCDVCDAIYKVPLSSSISIPTFCDACKRKALKLIEEDSEFLDVQRAEIQELLERVKGGTPPARLELWMEDDLVNSTIPGNTVEITGVLRLRPPSTFSKNATSLIYTRYLDVIYVKGIQQDFEELEITEDDKKKILEFSKDSKLFEKVVKSIAPGIYGHDEIKQAIALQLFGGTKGKEMVGGAKIRDNIHILLIGDPGAAKSRLLQYVVDLAPKSLYVSGKSVSGVGLTVSVEKDELSDGGWTLKAGALVLASGGIVGVDEFDKIDKDERSSLHEVMESGTISVAKAGIVARLKSKTSILAAANPKYGRFDPNKFPAEQFNIPPTLLSRFDLIFPIMDILDETRDRELAEKILSSHKLSADDTQVIADESLVQREFLKKYIAYSRQHIRPILTEEASNKIKDYYSKMRKMGKKTGAIPITPRQIEGLVRMAEAGAKLRLSDKVMLKDSDLAISLMEWMMQKIGMDQETGVYDIDILATGKPKSQIDKIQIILKIVEEINKTNEMAEIKEVIERASEFDIDKDLAKRLIEELIYKGELYKPKTGYVKIADQF
ncbi:minichromosome maintenance protein MCM [Candidatus Micrarchaeota archaeon]|nr:minichromosome maintenance protein MCM [Candidatus Micrarchaeota archaeon]